jgi:2-methylcitrate dehydratase PrpD
LSGAVTAGRLRGSDAGLIENALGIAFTQVSGSRQMAVGASTDLRSMQAGFSGQGAVLATELAARGIVGSKEIIEGRYGIYRTYVRNEPAWSALTEGLGTSFPLLHEHGFKVWPACGYTRATNTATQRLRRENRLSPVDVETITVIGGTGATRLLSEPIELKRRPQLSIDGKYSIPFTTAVMMVHGNVTLRDYTEEGLRDPAVLAMADRVGYRADPDAALPIGGQSALSRPTVGNPYQRWPGVQLYARRCAWRPHAPGRMGPARSKVPGLRFLCRPTAHSGWRRADHRNGASSRPLGRR